MKLEDIQELWQKDSEIDITRLTEESLNISKLHSKYYKLYINEVLQYKKLEAEHKSLRLEKYEFYVFGITDESTSRGWRLPPQGKILKAEVQQYLDADKDIIKSNLRLALQKEKVDFIQSIVESLKGRSFNIRNAIEFEKFRNGAA